LILVFVKEGEKNTVPREITILDRKL